MTNFDVVTHMGVGRGLVSRGSATPQSG